MLESSARVELGDCSGNDDQETASQEGAREKRRCH
jgi:hypothetical protein